MQIFCLYNMFVCVISLSVNLLYQYNIFIRKLEPDIVIFHKKNKIRGKLSPRFKVRTFYITSGSYKTYQNVDRNSDLLSHKRFFALTVLCGVNVNANAPLTHCGQEICMTLISSEFGLPNFCSNALS